MSNSNILIIMLLLFNIIFFCIGYLSAKCGQNFNSENNLDRKKGSVHNKNLSNIDINDKKIVTKIDTDSLEKKYQDLGEIKDTQEDLSVSINKLKNMKG